MANPMTPEQFELHLQKIAPALEKNVEKVLKLCCQKVRSDIVYSMDHTERDSDKFYFTNNKNIPHHPSIEGQPPAPDTGRLKGSISYQLEGNAPLFVGRVGSTLNNPPYGAYLETGTSRNVAPRPWLRPAMQKNSQFIRDKIIDAVYKSFNAKMVGGGE